MLPIFPLLLVLGIIAIGVKYGDPPKAAVPAKAGTPPRALHGVSGTFQGASSMEARRFSPEEERLFSLLVLFARDKRYPAGQKRYLTPEMALEALLLSKQLGLPKTVMAIRKDGAIPDDEFLRGLSGSVRQLALSYGTGGRL